MGQCASLILGSGPSRFEASRQASKGSPKIEDLRPNPLTGMGRAASVCHATRRRPRARRTALRLVRAPRTCAANPNPNPNPDPNSNPNSNLNPNWKAFSMHPNTRHLSAAEIQDMADSNPLP